ncbi:beta-1,4-galactosyltransferase 4-like [Anticarsia gemmatalis]|uniref:beta-1,4-galactosyltransferase 4-like n=1 Tax=Anticarsia gemmatalis TaxID=129554 RepID=UPI003F75770D
MLSYKDPHTCGINCACGCFCRKSFCPFSSWNTDSKLRQWVLVLTLFLVLLFHVFYNVSIHYNYRKSIRFASESSKSNSSIGYMYQLINLTEIPMALAKYPESSSYLWFVNMRHLFKNLGEDEDPQYSDETPYCDLSEVSMGPIQVEKTRLPLEWVESQHYDVKPGGFHAPEHCRSQYRVAILVPYRDREKNLIIFLYYLHRLLKKLLLEYRIFVFEQYGTEKWNKGRLYNIAYLESQRFGTWDCLIFHDVDLIPEDERILYNCSRNPLHMASSVENCKYILPYRRIFGGVTALTPAQYEVVNGYSNFYWDWGAEDDDMFSRLAMQNYTIWRSNFTIGRYSSLPHKPQTRGRDRSLLGRLCRWRNQVDGLHNIRYKIISVSKERLFTHIVADVNPDNLKLDSRNLIKQLGYLNATNINRKNYNSMYTDRIEFV